MKFTFTKEVLLKEMAIAQEIISNKTAISILSNVLLIVKEGSLTIRATDIKVAFETKLVVLANNNLPIVLQYLDTL